MTKYKIQLSGRFKKSYKRCMKRGLDASLFEEVVSLLSEGKELPLKYKNDELILCLLATGTHSDLF